MSPQDELPELDANELALLAAFADDEGPGATTRARVKDRVLESTVAAAPTGTVVRGPWVPWVAGTVLAAAAAALLVLAVGDSNVTAVHDRDLQQAPDTPEAAEGIRVTQEPAPTPARRRAPAPATEVPPVPPTAVAPTEVLSAVPASPEPEPATPSTPRRSATQPRKAAPIEAPEVVSPTSLAEETRLLDRARRAVVENRPKDALSLLREAQRKFPQGVLRQERAVLRVVALCDAGRVIDGRQAASAFLRTHPRSALRSRVQSACPEATP